MNDRNIRLRFIIYLLHQWNTYAFYTSNTTKQITEIFFSSFGNCAIYKVQMWRANQETPDSDVIESEDSKMELSCNRKAVELLMVLDRDI